MPMKRGVGRGTSQQQTEIEAGIKWETKEKENNNVTAMFPWGGMSKCIFIYKQLRRDAEGRKMKRTCGRQERLLCCPFGLWLNQNWTLRTHQSSPKPSWYFLPFFNNNFNHPAPNSSCKPHGKLPTSSLRNNRSAAISFYRPSFECSAAVLLFIFLNIAFDIAYFPHLFWFLFRHRKLCTYATAIFIIFAAKVSIHSWWPQFFI